TACGGGGGGSRTVGNFTISTTTVTFDGDPSGPAPAPAVVTGSITGVDETVFLTVTLTSNGLANAVVDLTGPTTGALTIFPKSPAQLGFGTFNDTVTVSACLDAGCSRPVGGSPKTINVTYNVRGLGVSPTSVTLSSREAVAAVPQQLTLANNSGANWTSAITYQGTTSGWLTLTPASAATQGDQQVTFNAGALNAPGTYTAAVQFTAGNRTRSVPVTYTVLPNLGVGQSTVTLSAVTGQTAPPTGANVAVTAANATAFNTTISYGPGATGWLATTGNSAPGTLGLAPQTVALPPGTYRATVTLAPLVGAPVIVTVDYTLEPSLLTLAPDEPTFTINGASTAAAQFLQRTVATGDTGAPLTWVANVSVPWLTVTPSGSSGQNAVLTLVPSALESVRNGTHQVGVRFTYNGPSVVNELRELLVELTLNLPTIDYAMPYVAYLNEDKEIIVRGSGFDQPGGAALTFDGTAAAEVEVVSDTQLRVKPPASAVSTASRSLLAIANALNLERSAAEIVARAKPTYGNQQVANPDIYLSSGWRVLYDAERDVVFGSRTFSFSPPTATLDSVMKFALDPSGVNPPTFTFKQYLFLNDIALSPDGRTLYVLTNTELHFADPVTLAELRSPVPVPSGSGGVAGRMAVANDGRILMPHLRRFYLPQSNSFEEIDEPIGDGLSEVSADGSRIALQTLGASGLVRFGTFDAGADEFQFMTEERFSQVVSLNRSGTLIAAGGEVFNTDFTLYGATAPPGTGQFSRLSPAGDRLYALGFSQPRQLLSFDTSAAAAAFPELTPLDVPFEASSMGISLNGEHVFIISEGVFFVVEP
ncbi:MAG TPA: hypothetical protein VFO35_19670, partial [Steroidobacteraceae bacterium]|nr:hypothetical protein [Steroidobacteraceae bacterium]